jgi:hypothetical protein
VINRYRFYMGQPGAMKMLPPLPKGANSDATVTRVGVSHQSLNGTVTVDHFGYKRQWQWPYTYLNPTDVATLDGFYRGFMGQQLRLLDPRKVNFLSGQVSSAGTEKQGTSSFTASSGTLAWVTTAVASMPTDLQGLLSGVLNWTGASANATLLTSSTTGMVIPSSYYCFSQYVSGSGTYQALIQPYDVNGNALTATTSATVTLSGTYQRVTISNYTPPSGAVSFAVGGKAISATPTVNVTGLQCQIDQALSAWVPGNGIPLVAILSFGTKYPYQNLYAGTMIVQEL